jgi:hypothetical protein
VHSHSHTCFKHMRHSTAATRDANRDCQFRLPRDIVQETYYDEDGHINLKCTNPFMNGYNDVVVLLLRCNMDVKFIGSGTAGLAMIEYVTNYIAKTSLDSSVVVAALSAALKAVTSNPPLSPDGTINTEDRARQFLVKTCNRMVANGNFLASK